MIPYNKCLIDDLLGTISQNTGLDKSRLSEIIQQKYSLVKDRKVFYCTDFAIRFSSSKSRSFSNTVLSLSNLRKYDCQPFIICLVTPNENILFIANSTFINKISHSSHELREDNIRGSFNGSDIIKEVGGIKNSASNFQTLYLMHSEYSFEENLPRIVKETNQIEASGSKFEPNKQQVANIMNSIQRAVNFIDSKEYDILDSDLRERLNKVKNEIAIAAFIDNGNLRGRIIEYLITSNGGDLKERIIDSLQQGIIPPNITTANDLADYERDFTTFYTATDIKTKVLFLSSNPKGYNIDKLLEFLSRDNTVYLIYIIAIDKNKNISSRLCSMFNQQLINATCSLHHWAGRNSRGVTQYKGKALEEIVSLFDKSIDADASHQKLKEFLSPNKTTIGTAHKLTCRQFIGLRVCAYIKSLRLQRVRFIMVQKEGDTLEY